MRDQANTSFGPTLRQWRSRRGISQMELALMADVSARHVAFLETGRARPSRSMVLRLSEALAVPRGDRNDLLAAAGFAPAYANRSLDQAEMATICQALAWTLQRHTPYPAFALDRHWALVSMNEPATRLLGAVGVSPGTSLLNAMLASGPLRDAIENWQEVAAHLSVRLRTESRQLGGDPILDAAAARLAAQTSWQPLSPGVFPAMISTRYRAGDHLLAFFSTIAHFGSAEDIALADLKIELLFPADETTRSILVQSAGA